MSGARAAGGASVRRENGLTVASQYGAAGSSTRVRLYDWLDHTGIVPGHRFEYRGASSNSPQALALDPRGTWSAERAARHLVSGVAGGTVVLSRELSPLSSGAVEARVLASAARGVYDYDDALYAPLPVSVPLLGKLLSRRRLWERAVDAADVVIAGSDLLAEHAAQRGADVVVIPSCVEHESYHVKTRFELGNAPLAVWIGSPSTEPYLSIVTGPLLRAHRETGLRLRVISAGAADLGQLEPMVDRVAWSADTFAAHLTGADFGIMPLPDNEWTRGKCAYKLLQYGAAGMPVIGSAVGANVPVLDALGGLAAGDDAAWSDGIIDLIRSSAAQRRAAGEIARHAVVEGFSFAAWRETWLRTVGLG